MDNSDADSIGKINDVAGQQLQVIKIYPLDGKPVANSQLWISVIQLKDETSKRLFLRDCQQHRSISIASAVRLLSNKDKKDLYALLKINSNKGGSVPAIIFNTISPVAVNSNDNPSISDKKLDSIDINGHFETQYIHGSPLIKLTSDSHAGVVAAVHASQLMSLGAIKVTGSEYFRRQLWLEAASRGMYVEGYVHTEEDRESLFMRMPESDRVHIRPEYKPVKLEQPKKTIPLADLTSKPSGIKNLKARVVTENLPAEPMDLSEQELTYLLMRVQQMEHDKINAASNQPEFYPLNFRDTGLDEIEP